LGDCVINDYDTDVCICRGNNTILVFLTHFNNFVVPYNEELSFMKAVRITQWFPTFFVTADP